jgi:hypothetical protein
VFFDEGVDIHHIFPQKWCEAQKIAVKDFDTVTNKTPLSYRTNRIIGGIAPSQYLAKLELGKNGADGKIEDPPIAPDVLDSYLRSHGISPTHLRADDFESFMTERRKALLTLIGTATGHPVNEVADAPEEGEELSEEVARDSGISTASA